MICVPPLVWHDAGARAPELTLAGMCMGALYPLVGPSLGQVLWQPFFAVICTVFGWPWALTRAQLTILSVTMLQIFAGRMLAVVHALGRGSRPALSPFFEAINSFVEAGSVARAAQGRARPDAAGWRGARMPASIVRTDLGPP